jgi:hypothetical protein
MSAHLQFSTLVNRPLSPVFHFFADEHVRNHPRWDPDIDLWQDSPQPIQLGAVIQRRNRRSGTPVEGSMEVVEYERDKALGMHIHDGAQQIIGRTTFQALNDRQTLLTVFMELPDMDETMDKAFLYSRLERSSRNIKQLMESEI